MTDADADLDRLDHAALLATARAMRAAIRAHRDATGHGLCWHHPDMWALLPDTPAGGQVVPDWPQFLRGCIRYRASLDAPAGGGAAQRQGVRGMRALFYSALFLTIGTNVNAQELEFDEAEVKEHCAEEWTDDFAMQNFCVDQIAAGYRDFGALLSAEQDDVMLQAMDNCRQQWGIEWNMVSFCSEQQVTARSKLPAILGDVPAEVSSTIRTKCEFEWPADFAMTAFCADQAVSGWRNMNE